MWLHVRCTLCNPQQYDILPSFPFNKFVIATHMHDFAFTAVAISLGVALSFVCFVGISIFRESRPGKIIIKKGAGKQC